MSDTSRKRIRTCVGCAARSDKVELFRIVRKADGGIAFDPSGRLPGRGAYVCSPDCLADALKARKLQRALRVAIGQEDMDMIASQLGDAYDEEGRG